MGKRCHRGGSKVEGNGRVDRIGDKKKRNSISSDDDMTPILSNSQTHIHCLRHASLRYLTRHIRTFTDHIPTLVVYSNHLNTVPLSLSLLLTSPPPFLALKASHQPHKRGEKGNRNKKREIFRHPAIPLLSRPLLFMITVTRPAPAVVNSS